MKYSDYKEKVFAESPTVKEEYDKLTPQYDAICKAIASYKTDGLSQSSIKKPPYTNNEQ